jgi:hypothetical protein
MSGFDKSPLLGKTELMPIVTVVLLAVTIVLLLATFLKISKVGSPRWIPVWTPLKKLRSVQSGQ